jgi:hypothetical protein
MAPLTNWLLGLAALLSLATFLFSAFDLLRRILARYALRICQQRNAREGGFICELKQRLNKYAKKPLLPKTILMIGSLGMLIFILGWHSPKL